MHPSRIHLLSAHYPTIEQQIADTAARRAPRDRKIVVTNGATTDATSKPLHEYTEDELRAMETAIKHADVIVSTGVAAADLEAVLEESRERVKRSRTNPLPLNLYQRGHLLPRTVLA